MGDQELASRTFGLNDQVAFARLSSDWNPMHLDHAFARRSQMGAPVVHGIHTLVWAADAVLRSSPLGIANIRAEFLQPLYLDETASVRIRDRSDRRIKIEVVAANTVVASVSLSSAPAKPVAETAQPSSSTVTDFAGPANLRFEQLAGHTGAVATGDADVGLLFPALTDAIGAAAVRDLLATSQVVGMACPGLHSLFAGLDVNCNRETGRESVLAYAVSKTDARFRSLQIDVSGAGITGRLNAFARPAPPIQPGMSEISARVSGKPFAGQRSLIIGGSRGLGEVTAKIVAAGGGRPVITYRDSEHEARQVAADIIGAGGQCDILRYDALSPPREQLRKLSGAVDCCYYFATPKIFQRKSALYEPEKLRTFVKFYADGFFELCAALAPDGTGKLAMFYPSTVAIDQAAGGTTEYAMAKVAGEILAKYVNELMSGVHVLSRRLPRILTDQTATVGVARADNALDVMLPIVYEVQQMARPDPAPRG
jgi:acyl dehydratase/NAD(P)-dependent dehydrogenase (short-subunit alcohol dehydrogenase family)